MKEEERLSKINTGKTAELLLNHMNPDLLSQREATIGRMKAMYRDGSYTEVKLLACVAELCTIDDIENRLKSRIRSGAAAMESLANG